MRFVARARIAEWKAMSPILRRVLLVASLSFLPWPPLGSIAQAEPKKGGNLIYAYVSGPGTLDPYVSSSAVELEVIPSVIWRVSLHAGAAASLLSRVTSRRSQPRSVCERWIR
jgi:hypothetical protein